MAASKRMANWDLLRSLSMLLVVVCHSARYLPPVCGVDVAPALERLALVCDPVFFALSGFFAIRLVNMLADKGKFGSFAYYCWGIGAAAVVASLIFR